MPFSLKFHVLVRRKLSLLEGGEAKIINIEQARGGGLRPPLRTPT